MNLYVIEDAAHALGGMLLEELGMEVETTGQLENSDQVEVSMDQPILWRLALLLIFHLGQTIQSACGFGIQTQDST